MLVKQVFTGLSLAIFVCLGVVAEAPSINQPLPLLSIEDMGELIYENDQYSYRPWSTKNQPDSVRVLQYFAGTMGGSKMFEPFTDRLKIEFPQGGVHVTTVINLDAAMWGTTGLVISEVKASKQEFPGATIVLDEEGVGEQMWNLGKKGAVLAVMNSAGDVIYLSRQALSELELDATMLLLKEQVGS